MIALLIVIIIAGVAMLVRSALFWLYFIQLKSYRFDRIWLEMKQRAFWKLIFSKHRVILFIFFILWVAALGAMYSDINTAGIRAQIKNWFSYFVMTIIPVYMVAYLAQTIYELKKKTLKLPQLTLKVLVLCGVPLISEVSFFALSPYAQFLNQPLYVFLNSLFGYYAMFIIIEICQPFIMLGIFAIAYMPNVFLRRYFLKRAKAKIQAHKNLIVIGITGSYGKTSTKEFLAQILSKKYKVLKTPAHINVDVGVAKVILKELVTPKIIRNDKSFLHSPCGSVEIINKPHEVFIVEMGAYCKGEIRRVCELVKPQYAMLTGLSDQHLELFGSLKAIAEAKFELIEGVSDKNRIFANADSKPLIIEFERRNINPIWYGVSARAQLKVQQYSFSEKGTRFKINNMEFSAPLIGSASLNNLLGAISIAHLLEVDIQDIAQALLNIPFVAHTMEPHLNQKGALIIDDTYNANTEGVLAALSDLQYFDRPKKVFVFGEIVELGERTKSDHIQIAKAIAQSTNCVVLLPSRMRQFIYDTLVATGYDQTHILGIHERARINDLVNSDTVVLLEGREAGKIIEQLT